MAGGATAQECGWVDAFVAGTVPSDAVTCDAGVCQWRFEYRALEAHTLFEKIGAALEACLGPEATQDAPVNHPDSYDLRVFSAKDGAVYLSIKDKAALDATFVFLRRGP